MQTNNDGKGVFGVLPQELIVEILHKFFVFDLRLLDATNTYWRQLIKKSDLWRLHYREIMSTDTVHDLAMNYLWLAEVERAKMLSTLLGTNRERQLCPRVVEYITPCYKSYIKAIIKNKTTIYKDLEQIKTIEHLTAAETQLAIRLYWLVHQRLPMLMLELVPQENIWKHLLLPEELQFVLTENPALYWEDHIGERYYYNLALWIDKERITLYCAHWERWGVPELLQHTTVTGSFDVIKDQFPLPMLDNLPSGESSYFYFRNSNNEALLSERRVLYKLKSEEINWKLDQTAASVIARVNMSAQVTERDLKEMCDKWSPGNFNARSKHPKPAVVRCMRRMIFLLLEKEIDQFSTSVGPVFVGKQGLAYGKDRLSKLSVHASHPEYWPLFLLEKAYYCCEPLSHLMLALILRESHDKVALSTHALLALNLDPRAIDEVIRCYPKLNE